MTASSAGQRIGNDARCQQFEKVPIVEYECYPSTELILQFCTYLDGGFRDGGKAADPIQKATVKSWTAFPRVKPDLAVDVGEGEAR